MQGDIPFPRTATLRTKYVVADVNTLEDAYEEIKNVSDVKTELGGPTMAAMLGLHA